MNSDPIHVYTAIQKAFTKYCKRLDILQIGAHKARKTYISELIDHGININTVRAIAGHKDEHTTLNNYCYDLKTSSERHAQVITAIR
jgi:integrase